MIEKKYLIMIGVIICLLILYYFYDEIRNLKKSLLPTYQKTMALEIKVEELQKKTANMPTVFDKKSKNDSPVFSISYQSDMIKNPASVKYNEISETEAKRLKESIIKPVITKPIEVPKIYHVQKGDLSDFSEKTASDKLYAEKSDTINIKLSDFMSNKIMSDRSNDLNEYENILKGLKSTVSSENVIFSNDELDKKIFKNISESITYADLPSENTYSDRTPIKKTIKKNQKKYN